MSISTYTSIFSWANPFQYMMPMYAAYNSSIQAIYERCILEPARNFIRPVFYSITPTSKRDEEKAFFEEFWNPLAQTHPELPYQQKVRDSFSTRHETFPISLQGEKLQVKCCIIESKNFAKDQEHYNLVHILGVGCTSDTILHTYPLLESYLKLNDPLPARFIIVSQFDTKTEKGIAKDAKSLLHAGLVLSDLLKSLEEKYDTIHQIVAHSLGGIILSSALRFFNQPLFSFGLFWQKAFRPAFPALASPAKTFKTLPKNILFDRSPSSVYDLSKSYFAGSLFMQSSIFKGWHVHFAKEIEKYVKKSSSKVTVVGVRHDHRFNNSNLCNDPAIIRLAREKVITRLVLDIPKQFANKKAHHSLELNKLYPTHLQGESSSVDFGFIEGNLADAIIRNSMPSLESKS